MRPVGHQEEVGRLEFIWREKDVTVVPFISEKRRLLDWCGGIRNKVGKGSDEK